MMSILTRVVFSNTLRNPKNPFLSSREVLEENTGTKFREGESEQDLNIKIGKKDPKIMFFPKGNQRRPKTRLNSYVLSKYMTFVKMFEDSLNKYFPKGAKFYKVFSVGLKYFKADFLILFNAFKKIRSEEWDSLSRKELEVYYQLPKDMMRAAPVLFVASTMPFGGLVLVLAYNFPRQLLTYHFWSLQQRNEFALLSHKKKLEHYQPLFRLMENDLSKLKDKLLHDNMNEILQSIKSGKHPSKELILSCKVLFEKDPYGLEYLSRQHVVMLLKIYGLHRGWNRINRLESRALFLKLMDTAIIKEGGVEKLTNDEIIWNSFVRGLNPIDMKQEDVVKWMTTWLSVSQNVDEKSYSLLLHCPILLGYSEPSNWELLHGKTK